MREFDGFNAKLTNKYIYIESKIDSNIKYRVSGNLSKLWKFFETHSVKLIPLIKKLSKSQFKLETRTTQNKKTGKWLWYPGYQKCFEIPSGSLGGLDIFGSTYSGENDEGGMPLCIGFNRNSQNKGALKGGKVSDYFEKTEHNKWTDEEIDWLIHQQRKDEERKYDLREKCKK